MLQQNVCSSWLYVLNTDAAHMFLVRSYVEFEIRKKVPKKMFLLQVNLFQA